MFTNEILNIDTRNIAFFHSANLFSSTRIDSTGLKRFSLNKFEKKLGAGRTRIRARLCLRYAWALLAHGKSRRVARLCHALHTFTMGVTARRRRQAWIQERGKTRLMRPTTG